MKLGLLMLVLVFGSVLAVEAQAPAAESADDTPMVLALKTDMLVPARFFIDWLGVSMDTDPASGQVTLTGQGQMVTFTPNSATVQVNMEEQQMPVPALVIYDLLYLPLRFTAEVLQSTVGWNTQEQMAILHHPNTGEALNVPVRGKLFTVTADFDGDAAQETVYGISMFRPLPKGFTATGIGDGTLFPLVWMLKDGKTCWQQRFAGEQAITALAATELAGDGRPMLWMTTVSGSATAPKRAFRAYHWREGTFRNSIGHTSGTLACGSKGGVLIRQRQGQQPAQMLVYDAVAGASSANPAGWQAWQYTWNGKELFTLATTKKMPNNADVIAELRKAGFAVSAHSALLLRQGKIAFE